MLRGIMKAVDLALKCTVQNVEPHLEPLAVVALHFDILVGVVVDLIDLLVCRD
jgi:hypothetical protein